MICKATMDDTYSSWTGLIYVFNLIVGTGALTLPAAFFRSGWALGAALMCVLSFISYVTATFVVEAMSISNALINLSKMKQLQRISLYLSQSHQLNVQEESEDDSWISPSEESPLYEPRSIQNFPTEPQTFYTIDNKMEMADMARMFFSRGGRIAFFICITLYLFGDLSIFAAAIGQSMVDALCSPTNFTDPDDLPCGFDQSYTTLQVYRIFLVGFILLFGPFVFFNVQKTKYLQLTTSLTRWLAFGTMIYLTIQRLLDPSLPHNSPRTANISGFPSLLSSCVYAFMCHHSLPSLLSPISNKSHLHRNLLVDYFVVLCFYLMLAVPAVFAFPLINNLFSLNFVPTSEEPVDLEVAQYFLILFPVFTLTTSFPVVSVTLRNNLQSTVSASSSRLFRDGVLPLIATIPPVLLAILTPNLEFLVGITGSYAGVGIQYIIPASLVMVARYSKPPALSLLENPFASPFQNPIWPFIVMVWAAICIIFATVHNINKHFDLDWLPI